jgi:hypothetical protein
MRICKHAELNDPDEPEQTDEQAVTHAEMLNRKLKALFIHPVIFT